MYCHSSYLSVFHHPLEQMHGSFYPREKKTEYNINYFLNKKEFSGWYF